MIKKPSKPLEAEIKELKNKLNKKVEGQNFISDKHNKMANDYKSVLTKNKKQKEKINKLNKRTDDSQKKSDSHELKLDELEQYNRRQNLEFVENPLTENEEVTQITLDLVEK